MAIREHEQQQNTSGIVLYISFRLPTTSSLPVHLSSGSPVSQREETPNKSLLPGFGEVYERFFQTMAEGAGRTRIWISLGRNGLGRTLDAVKGLARPCRETSGNTAQQKAGDCGEYVVHAVEASQLEHHHPHAFKPE